MEKKATELLVEPATAASTLSPSRSRVCAGSLSSRTRFTQPCADSTMLASSATMKSSSWNSGSSVAPSTLVRRLSAYLALSSVSSLATIFQRLDSLLRSVSSSLAAARFSSRSLRMMRISRRARR